MKNFVEWWENKWGRPSLICLPVIICSVIVLCIMDISGNYKYFFLYSMDESIILHFSCYVFWTCIALTVEIALIFSLPARLFVIVISGRKNLCYHPRTGKPIDPFALLLMDDCSCLFK